MIETKSVTVAPDYENFEIQKWAKFGWVLKSSQEIYSKDSHLESRGDAVYSVTSTTNYVKLVFQRDTEMKNYQALKSLEQEYYSLIDPAIKGLKSFIIALIVGIVLVAYGIAEGGLPSIIAGLVVAAFSVLLIMSASKKNKQARLVIEDNRKKRTEIFEKCDALLM